MTSLARSGFREQMLSDILTRSVATVVGRSIIVQTDVLLPGGDHVVIELEGGDAGDSVTASDGGMALTMLAEMGLELEPAGLSWVRRFATRVGLHLESGVLRSRPVPVADASSLIVCTANAVRDVASAAATQGRRRHATRLRETVQRELMQIFSEASVQSNAIVRGRSEEQLRFDFRVILSRHQALVVDAPVPEPSSVAAVVLRQADAKAAHIEGLAQAIVYDDRENWGSTTLAQLQLAGVPLISATHLRTGLLSVVERQTA